MRPTQWVCAGVSGTAEPHCYAVSPCLFGALGPSWWAEEFGSRVEPNKRNHKGLLAERPSEWVTAKLSYCFSRLLRRNVRVKLWSYNLKHKHRRTEGLQINLQMLSNKDGQCLGRLLLFFLVAATTEVFLHFFKRKRNLFREQMSTGIKTSTQYIQTQ